MKTRRVTMSTAEALERLRRMNASDLRHASPQLRAFWRDVLAHDDDAILRRLGQLESLTTRDRTYREMRTELAVESRPTLPAEVMAALSPGGDAALAAVDIPEGEEVPWHTDAGFMLLDTPTGDGRTFAATGFRQRPPAVGAREVPMPLMANLETTWGHDGARLTGRVATMDASGTATAPPQASGFFSLEEDAGLVVRHIAAGNIRGISADLGIYESEMTFIEDEEGFIEAMEFVATMFDVMGITITPFPGFAACAILLDLPGAVAASAAPVVVPAVEVPAPPPVLTAAGGPAAPPAEWFADPEFSELTPLTVSDDGQRVYGHLAPWPEGGTEGGHLGCHIGFSDVCVCAEPSATEYAYFLTGDMLCADGSRQRVGTLTLRGGHGGGLTIEEINRHYDDTDSAAAYVNCGSDAFGTWCAGVVRAGITEEDLQALRCSSPSVHERELGGTLELVRVCMVNTPGLPVLRASGGVLPDLPAPTARVDGRGRVVELLASAGSRRLAVMKGRAMRPPSREEYDALEARLAGMEARLESADRALAMLDAPIRDAALARMV